MVAETPQTQITPTAEEQANTQPQEEKKERYSAPRGAFAFVLLLLAGYAVYWFITWFEIFILRGA